MTKKTEQSLSSKDFKVTDFIEDTAHLGITEDREQTGINDITAKTEQSELTKKTSSRKLRKVNLLDYQQTFLTVPKITDRKTVFISNELRERIVSIVRRLGTEKSSVSGFIENLVIHHLDEYMVDIESWKKL